MKPLKNNICLSLSLNYSYDFLKPFLKSFEKNCTGILYLVTDIPQEKFTPHTKIQVINFHDVVRKYNIISNLTPFNLKPIIFYLLLKELNNIDKVLISDVDVIFQKDSFTSQNEALKHDFVICEEKKVFSDCNVNLTWLQISYPEYENQLLDKKILNSGVVYGNKQTILNYLKSMTHELQTILPKCNYPILDQIILNILYYVRKNITPQILPHNNGYIVHLSQEDKSSITNNNIKDNKFVINNTENTIIHQYNKQPFLNSYYTNLYT
jgi:hypothetical protein